MPRFSTGDTVHLQHSRPQNQGCVPNGYSVSWRNVISCTKVSRSPCTQFPPFRINLPADKYFTTLIRQSLFTAWDMKRIVSHGYSSRHRSFWSTTHQLPELNATNTWQCQAIAHNKRGNVRIMYHWGTFVQSLLQWKSDSITYCECVYVQP